jgi:hypothetical protein
MAAVFCFSLSLYFCPVFLGLIYTVTVFLNLPTAGSSASGWTVFFLNSFLQVLHSGETVIFPLHATTLNNVCLNKINTE